MLISPLGQKGVLIAEPEGGKAQVQVGAMRMTVAANTLTPVAATREAAPSQSRAVGDLRLAARTTISPEIQLLGLRAREAVEALDAYLDDVCLAGVSPVRVVHGKGHRSANREPVLKKKVAAWLRQRDEVLAYCQALPADGGGGALLVLLKARKL